MAPVDDALDRPHRSEPDYIDRTIETVRNHRGADNCWPQWANIFADEIEDLRGDVRRLREERDATMRSYDSCLLTLAKAVGAAEAADAEADKYRKATDQQARRAEAAEAEKRQLRKGLREIDKLDGRYHDLNTARWMARKTLDSLAGPSADAALVPAGEPSDG